MDILLNNKGLQALTVGAEKEEIKLVALKPKPSLTARIQAAQCRRRKIIFAHFQKDFKGGLIPYWHVTLAYHPSFQSTLSMQGLKEWKVL